MLSQLSIKNYALIDDIQVTFTKGFTTITGETGAGKSILLGGLSLVLGKRADMSTLRDPQRKCVIEAEFLIKQYGLQQFFEKHDLEYDPHTIIRREIHPSGKSRAFINDSPVTLDLLSQLGRSLIDVHSQHQTLQLTEQAFQLYTLDALAGNQSLLSDYQIKLKEYNGLRRDLTELKEKQQTAVKDHDYNSFLYRELEEARLQPGQMEELEEEFGQLSNIETIIEHLSSSNQLITDEQYGLVSILLQLRQIGSKLEGFGEKYQNINDRLESVLIEIDDLSSELQSLQENMVPDPKRLEELGDQLQIIYDLQKKHSVSEVSELIEIRDKLSQNLTMTEDLDDLIVEKEALLLKSEEELRRLSKSLSTNRMSVIPSLKDQLESLLKELGMPNASFKVQLLPGSDFTPNGTDKIIFLFSANKGTEYGTLKKVASGGEMSRIMLVIKSILADFEQLPTLMFDEIDSGVSGDISNAMADIMLGMSKNMQVFAITHLPQVASKGQQHYKVYKVDEKARTATRMKLLEPDERVVELAEMLGGKSLSDAALAHAKDLLN